VGGGGGGGAWAVASAAIHTVYSPVRCVLCLTLKSYLLLYYNKWWNISVIPCHLHYSVAFKKIQNVNQVFFADTYTRRVLIFACLLEIHHVYYHCKDLKLSSINPSFFKAASSLRNALRHSGRYPLSNANIRNTMHIYS
jgi:hypothetical protein